METLVQIARRVRTGLKARFAEIEGLAFSVRVASGYLIVEITQVRPGFLVLGADERLTREAIAFRASIEAYARPFLGRYDGLQVRYGQRIMAAELARLAGQVSP